MKIKGIHSLPLSAVQRQKGKREELSGPDFQKLLKEAHSNLKQVSQGDSPPRSPDGVRVSSDSAPLISPLAFPPKGNENYSLRALGTQATEKILDLLEKYQKAMGDSQISLKEIYPLLQSLSQGVKGLTQMSENLSPSDPLKKIIDEISVLSAVEGERFNRGDYV